MGDFAQRYGLHPLVAAIVISADTLLVPSDTVGVFFSPESAGVSAAIAVVLSIVIAAILMVACILLQRYTYRDNWGTAVGKGLIVGIITAIPTSFPSIITAGSGVVGIVGLVKRSRAKKGTTAKRERPSRTSKKK